jgi:hexosaminidase
MHLDVIPTPALVSEGVGVFTSDGSIFVERAASEELVSAALAVLGPRMHVTDSSDAHLRLEPAPADALRAPDGYVLDVGAAAIVLRAATREGFLNGAQTLRQLLPVTCEDPGAPVEPFEIPAVHIEDAPRFAWRGLHVDVARHHFPLVDLKRLVDTMALFKFNRLHWHLVDDQGWRLEIKSHPRLAEVGGRRRESPRRGARDVGDGTAYAGFYTQDEVRALVAHAAGLGITVVPEIEMPGHAQAAIAAYPELGHGEAPEVWTRWGVSERIFNVRDETLAFLGDVLFEVTELFPGPYVHLGGDEVPTTEWEHSESAKARMAQERLATPRDLQGWFLARMATELTRHGRRAICWDEVLECGAEPDVIVMVWREARHARTAAGRGHDVVLCPQPFCYLDHYQGDPATEPEAIGGNTDWRKVLAFDPLAGDWTPTEARHVLGVQGNLWSEYIHDARHLEYMAWPRASALAEIAWSPPGERDPADFATRFGALARRLDAMGVNYKPVRS